MYDNLLRLPYFQGMSRNDITSVLDKVKLEFTSYAAGSKILTQGDKCNKFIIILNGEVKTETCSSDESYRLIEIHEAPYTVEPYSIFGSSTEYNRNYYASSDCSVLKIDKSYFFSEFTKHDIFTLNLLNIISHRAQTLNRKIWQDPEHDIEQRIIQFIAMHSETLHGSKTILIKMDRMASLLCETRINVSKALNELQRKGFVKLSRKEIHIPNFELLLSVTTQEE